MKDAACRQSSEYNLIHHIYNIHASGDYLTITYKQRLKAPRPERLQGDADRLPASSKHAHSFKARVIKSFRS